jgi:uncharacterized protein YndB with AHSA1/START domain
MNNPITVSAQVSCSASDCYTYWTGSEHIPYWSFADPSWGAEVLSNSLEVGEEFAYRLFAKDGSAEFVFGGTFTELVPGTVIAFTMSDGRKVEVVFRAVEGGTEITERFEAESVHSREMQEQGWQQFLNNFKTYAESQTHKPV